jgi:hypothetical protein
MAPLDPGQDPTGGAPQGRDIFGQQDKAKRQHPQTKDG